MYTQRPTPAEHGEYFGRYVDLVPDGHVLAALEKRGETTQSLLATLDEERGNHRYAQGKWSLKEVVGHLVDCERVFVYRALCFARGDRQPLPGFEQDDFVRVAKFDARPLVGLAEELRRVRRSSLAFFGSLEEDAWSRPGHAAGSDLTVRAVPWILVGHEAHHMSVIQERYLAS